VLLRLAEKAFRPGKFPFPVMHVDTGHNFPEVIEYRDRRVAELGETLIVASVQESIDKGRVVEETGPRASRNQLQTTTLLDAIETPDTPLAARRDEERPAPRSDLQLPRRLRPVEPARSPSSISQRVRRGEHVRVFRSRTGLELDVAVHRPREPRPAADLLRPRARGVPPRRDAVRGQRVRVRMDGEEPFTVSVRFRTVGDMCAPAPSRLMRSRRGRGGDAPHGSRNAERPAPTTAPARRRWRIGSALATSEQLMATDLLRLVTAGSVDDGKSTLIGRLLFDTKQILADQLEHIEETSKRRGDGYVNLALLTDGLRAEREQGITIDVAYRSFVTPRRRFQLADAPGHVQYTRNMVTGASTADVAIILVDARKGVIEQTRRHSYLAAILGIPHVVVAVNKMDLAGFSEQRFREIEQELRETSERLGLRDVHVIPMSALRGDNVVERGEGMPWYDGLTLLEHLESVEIAGDRTDHRRFPFSGDPAD
jgi:small GTP-binding protein